MSNITGFKSSQIISRPSQKPPETHTNHLQPVMPDHAMNKTSFTLTPEQKKKQSSLHTSITQCTSTKPKGAPKTHQKTAPFPPNDSNTKTAFIGAPIR